MAEKMVDKVTRLMQSPDRIRNMSICAHIDHGKTTFSDNLLAGAGMMSKDDAGKALKLDFHEDEKERGITIFSKNASINYKDYKINIVDTPGHADFGGEVQRIMKMVDCVLLIVDAF